MVEMKQCPHCSSRVREDRLAKHVANIHARHSTEVPSIPNTSAAKKAADTAPTDVEYELRQLAQAQNTGWRVSDVARERANRIAQSRSYLASNQHRIAFVGQIGIGKSAMITVLCRLFVGDMPTDKATLKDNSVLALGAGGTTVCEVRIRARIAADRAPYGLIIEPYTIEEMRNEIRLFALDEWTRRNSTARVKRDDDEDPTPREVQRVIREMTNLSLRRATVTEKDKKSQITVDPLSDVVKKHQNPESLANDLVERANLLSRTETEWWWGHEQNPLYEVKSRFHDVNHGRAPTAMLPRRITLVVEAPIPNLKQDLDIEIIDTRGFDGRLAGRSDIQEVLRDHRTIIVLCTPFREAPGEAVKTLLGDIQSDAVLASASDRIVLVLLDHGDGETVNGADGDRAFGQDLKLRECENVLLSSGLNAFIGREKMVAFDALNDDRTAIVHILESHIESMREGAASRLEQQEEDARSFLANLENERIALARSEVDQRLFATFSANIPTGSPLRDPLNGIYDGIRGCRYASQVYASCRRNGSYWALDAYAAARSGASRAATDWLREFNAIMNGALRTLEQDDALADAIAHIRLRKEQYAQGYVRLIDAYAGRVEKDVRSTLYRDSIVWLECQSEWGRGAGFKDRVVRNLERWSRSAATLDAHERTELEMLLPFRRTESLIGQ